MQHDDMIWNVINKQFCSHQTTLNQVQSEKHNRFCRHPYSTTGLCNRGSCPLANSKYAVVREIDGVISLFIKTPERAHSPKNLWERIQLSRNYATAIKQIDEHLAYFPKIQIHRNKQRLTKIHQYLLKMRKIELKARKGRKTKLVPRSTKVDTRENRREEKALVAAKIEDRIENELLQRLAKGTYGDIYNFPEVEFSKIMEKMEEEEEEEEEESINEENVLQKQVVTEYVEDLEDFDDENELEDLESYTSGSSENDEEDDDHSSNSSQGSDKSNDKAKRKTQNKKENNKRRKMQIEYEDETNNVQEQQEQVVPGMAW